MEKINYCHYHCIASKSEESGKHQQLLLENEQITGRIDMLAEIYVTAHNRKRIGRHKPHKKLPRIRVEHDLPEIKKQCNFGQFIKRKHEETTVQYDVMPAKLKVIENIKFKYVCSNPKCNELPKTIRQELPPPLPRTQVSLCVLTRIGTSKFVDSLSHMQYN